MNNRINVETILNQLARIRHKAGIADPTGSSDKPDGTTLGEALEELGVAFEELRVAGEELTRQESEIESLRDSLFRDHNRYQDLFDSAPDGYLVTDPYGRIGDANRAAAEMLNVSQDTLTGKPLASYICPVTRGRFRHELDLLKSIDRDGELMVLMQPRDREPIMCGLRSRVARDRDGRAIGCRWLIRDISERHAAEGEREIAELLEEQINAHVEAERMVASLLEELDEHTRIESSLVANENIYRLIAEHGIEGAALARADGTVLFASPATRELLGISPIDAIGRNVFEYLHPRDREAVAELVNILMLTPGSEIHTCIRHRHADRSWRRLAVRAVNMIGTPYVDAIMIYYRELENSGEVPPGGW